MNTLKKNYQLMNMYRFVLISMLCTVLLSSSCTDDSEEIAPKLDNEKTIQDSGSGTYAVNN